jgi:hypothetical protein
MVALPLLKNEGGNQNNWLKIRVRTNSNKSGIGTKVEVKSGALWQKIEISGGNGYLSQIPTEFIFGLGQHKTVDAMRLLWPGGVLQSEINIPINQTKLVNELDRKGTSCPLLYTWNGEVPIRDGFWVAVPSGILSRTDSTVPRIPTNISRSVRNN